MIDNTKQAEIIGAYLPDGKAFESKNIPSKNMYKFVDAIAKTFVLTCNDIEEVKRVEMFPDTTEDLISRWEKQYGIPDSCFSNKGSLEERRQNILIKIGMNGVQTVADFENLALKFGLNVEVKPGAGSDLLTFPLAFPWVFTSAQQARFILIVDLPTILGTYIFPFTVTKFPFPFGSSNGNIIECVFTKLVPANVKVIFRYIL